MANTPPKLFFWLKTYNCLERLTYEAVAARLGVSVAALKRWGNKYEWRRKREELAKDLGEIKEKTIKARLKMLEKVIAKGGAQDAFAVAGLESLAIEQEKLKAAQIQTQAPPVHIESAAQAGTLLENALAAKLGAMLSDFKQLDLKTLKDFRDALHLLDEMKGKAQDENSQSAGLSALSVETIIKALSSKIE